MKLIKITLLITCYLFSPVLAGEIDASNEANLSESLKAGKLTDEVTDVLVSATKEISAKYKN